MKLIRDLIPVDDVRPVADTTEHDQLLQRKIREEREEFLESGTGLDQMIEEAGDRLEAMLTLIWLRSGKVAGLDQILTLVVVSMDGKRDRLGGFTGGTVWEGCDHHEAHTKGSHEQ